MTLQILGCLTAPGSETAPNEDAAGHGAYTAWALDGATGLSEGRLLPGPSDAAWLVDRYGAALREHADREQGGTRRLLADVIAEVARAFREKCPQEPERRYELPSAGMALVRFTPGKVECARLGDCRVILGLPGGRVVATKRSALARLDARVIRRMRDLRESGVARNHAEARAAVQDDLRANRERLNVPGGYWVLGTDPEAARRMEVRVIPLDAGVRVRGLLVTDGFYRLVDTFPECRDDAELLDRTFDVGPEEMLRRLRALEDADSECTRYPRFKPKDDATAVLFQATAPR